MRWFWLVGTGFAAVGCRFSDVAPYPTSPDNVIRTSYQDEDVQVPPLGDPTALATEPGQPSLLAVYLARALAENRDVQAARLNVLALKARVPQVTALDDPMVQNGMWPFPSNAPQYSLMGYMPYELLISQQFPWLGTLRLRGCVAEKEARVALWQLAEAQLAAVAEVKRAYYDARAAAKIQKILEENRKVSEEIIQIARARLVAGGNEQDVLRSEIAVANIDREMALNQRDQAEALAALSRFVHDESDAPLDVSDDPLALPLPTALEQLTQIAIAARPNLQARLMEIDRDRHEVALAKKRYWPNLNVGVAYGTMTKINSPSAIADGRDNVGFTLGFNLPIWRGKLDAGVQEAQFRLLTSTQRYESERDEAVREVRSLIAEARAEKQTYDLLNDRIAPKSRLALLNAAAGYRAGTLDFVTLNSAREELLAVEVEVTRAEAKLAKALAELEKAVGTQLETASQ